MFKDLSEKIYKNLSLYKNIVLIGKTDSGKTHYVINDLITFLNQKRLKVIYFPNCDALIDIKNNVDVVIIDEVETLLDKKFLEQKTDNGTYYSSAYLEKVKKWHKKLENIKIPSIFVLTRNKEEEINNLVKNTKIIDWGMPVEYIVFPNKKNE